MRRAVIDLGTNTFNLLIGELNKGQLEHVYSEKIPVLLGMGGINQGFIDDSALTRAKLALRKFKVLCDDFQVSKINGIGTSALRAATNSAELVNFSKDELGIEIEIISGKEEAELIYHGVSWSVPVKEKSIIMDIGGGSTEFILADQNGIIDVSSLDIGVSRIFQWLNQPESVTQDNINEVSQFLEKHGTAFFPNVKSSVLIGSSGSFETMYELIFKEEFTSACAKTKIPLDRINKEIDWLISSTLEERMDNEWIVPIRKRMMPIAALQLKWVIDRFGINEIYVSPYSLKEGVFSKERN